MDAVDCTQQELISCDRIEEVQGQEKVDTGACTKGMRCMDYCIIVEYRRFGKCYGSAMSLRCLSEKLKVILQIPAEECNAFMHLKASCSVSTYRYA
jgi:hypothetical protein